MTTRETTQETTAHRPKPPRRSSASTTTPQTPTPPTTPGGAEDPAAEAETPAGDDPAADDGDTGDDATPEPEPEPEPEPDLCETSTPGAVEIGVSADEITVLIAADSDTPLAPGLFEDAFIAAEAWAEHVNDKGGLACRTVRVERFDTVLNPSESVNAQIAACENALAMVGTTALFVFDVSQINTCPDINGNEIGIPDVAQITTEVVHQCSANTFTIIAPQGACPYSGTGERLYSERVGHIAWFQENLNPDLVGVFIVPGDLPSTRQTGITTVRAAVRELGVEEVAAYAVSGTDLQPVYAEFVQAAAQNNANYARTGSEYRSLIKWRSEAEAQGVEIEIWECTIACYDTAIFELGGGVEDGTYMTIFTLPFEEAELNDELSAYVNSVDNPSSFGLNAWAAGVLFEEAVAQIIDNTGDVNAITRANLLETLKGIDSYDARGFLGTVDPVNGISSECFVLLQIQGQEFVRIHPEEPGTFDCHPDNSVEITMDAAAEAATLS